MRRSTSSLTGVWLHGPAAAASLDDRARRVWTRLAAWPTIGSRSSAFGEAPVVVARIDQLGVPGFAVYVAPAREPSLEAALGAAGVVAVGADALEAARIEAGYPLFGVDMTDDTIPLEAGIEARAISLTKGCYVGQEVIIRVLHRGHGRVARKLVASSRRAGTRSPAGASVVFAADTDDRLRHERRASSPRLGAIALGYVHRDFVEPGTAVAVHVGRAATSTPTVPHGALR